MTAVDELATTDACAVPEDIRYSTTQVVHMTGATYRMVDYWDRRGWLRPSTPARGSGSHREFDISEVETIRYALDLQHAGFAQEASLRIGRELVRNGRWAAAAGEIHQVVVCVADLGAIAARPAEDGD